MKLHNLKRAHNFEVENYLTKKLNLTDYQVSKMKSDEIIRFSRYYFYEWDKPKQSNILWRLSIIPYLIFVICLYLFLPFTFLFRGEWGYGQKFYDNFYRKWAKNLRI